jgi:hypothetical protein
VGTLDLALALILALVLLLLPLRILVLALALKLSLILLLLPLVVIPILLAAFKMRHLNGSGFRRSPHGVPKRKRERPTNCTRSAILRARVAAKESETYI